MRESKFGKIIASDDQGKIRGLTFDPDNVLRICGKSMCRGTSVLESHASFLYI